MSLPPEQRALVDDAIQRKVAVSALRHIHRIIQDDAADEARGRRFAALFSSLALAIAALVLTYVVFRGVVTQLGLGLDSPEALRSRATAMFVYVLLTGCFAAAAAYFATTFPRPARRFAAIGLAVSVLAAGVAAAMYYYLMPVNGCPTGIDAASRREFEKAIPALNQCLSVRGLAKPSRVQALKTRAWALYMTEQYGPASADMDAVFRLEPTEDAVALTQYSSFLRRAGRLDDSLQALVRAEKVQPPGTAYVQFNKGLTLAALERHDEAVRAFGEALQVTPVAPPLWHRALSYEKLGRRDLARADLERCARLLAARPRLSPELKILLAKAESKLEEYRGGR